MELTNFEIGLLVIMLLAVVAGVFVLWFFSKKDYNTEATLKRMFFEGYQTARFDLIQNSKLHEDYYVKTQLWKIAWRKLRNGYMIIEEETKEKSKMCPNSVKQMMRL